MVLTRFLFTITFVSYSIILVLHFPNEFETIPTSSYEHLARMSILQTLKNHDYPVLVDEF